MIREGTTGKRFLQSINAIQLNRPTVTQEDGGASQVNLQVENVPVFFRSDTPLLPSIESYICAFLLPAMSWRMGLRVNTEVDRRLLENISQVNAIAKDWWGFSGGNIHAAKTHVLPRTGGCGMFFTGGVDSFFSLLRNKKQVQFILNVEGFDVQLTERERLLEISRWLQHIADECGYRFVTVQTNLRQHFLFQSVRWQITHVAALSSVAHTIRHLGNTMFVASTDVPPPTEAHLAHMKLNHQRHGTSPRLDGYWSSNAVKIINDGSEFSRLDKVRAIGNWALVHRFLRVCWENNTETLNCGVCEKCVRTQTQLLIAGTLDKMMTMPQGNLLQRIRELPKTDLHLFKQWQDIYDALKDQTLKSAVQSLLERSREAVFLRRPSNAETGFKLLKRFGFTGMFLWRYLFKRPE
jgi:hypothetical protein